MLVTYVKPGWGSIVVVCLVYICESSVLNTEERHENVLTSFSDDSHLRKFFEVVDIRIESLFTTEQNEWYTKISCNQQNIFVIKPFSVRVYMRDKLSEFLTCSSVYRPIRVNIYQHINRGGVPFSWNQRPGFKSRL